MYLFFFFCRIYDFKKKIYYDDLGDTMNSLEISIIINKMIRATKLIDLKIEIENLKQGLTIDKNHKK